MQLETTIPDKVGDQGSAAGTQKETSFPSSYPPAAQRGEGGGEGGRWWGVRKVEVAAIVQVQVCRKRPETRQTATVGGGTTETGAGRYLPSS